MMAKYQVYITESRTYETTVEATSAEAAIVAGVDLDTSSLTPMVDRSVSARLAAE